LRNLWMSGQAVSRNIQNSLSEKLERGRFDIHI